MAGETPARKLTPIFGTTFADFGYKIDSETRLRQIANDEPFEFNVRQGDKRWNQMHYEALADVVGKYIEDELVATHGFDRVVIPVDANLTEPTSKIFLTPDAFTADRLLLLVAGVGVSVGQWARSIVMNDSINEGSFFNYIVQAKSEGYGIVVLDPNETRDSATEKPIRGSETAVRHTSYVWQHFIRKAKAAGIFIVAHSYGGVCTLALLDKYQDEFMQRVTAIAFTDSVHDVRSLKSRQCKGWLQKNAVNWATSEKSLNIPLSKNNSSGCLKRSAGHPLHAYTTVTAQNCVFKYFSAKSQHLGESEDGSEASESGSGNGSGSSKTASPRSPKRGCGGERVRECAQC
ncbi:Arb2 domain-containing protein [Fimicolochytrium jonesii]|uniref:Arb2 domain-containing protein n=1 Tax=Fimicolochytrium jonesii TaxID=1396493 RepID=UPI0022FEEF12|nr:Arb2 domain-containing protein [Fimicolochytrium jonesii]KAI8820275.1 Arb2 domain-containing protein [Fimicolochytrium jonesii]